MLSFQQIILKLQTFWAGKSCALLQPYDIEVGAATSHPATFLRAIGPEPWRAAYVQPSRRPKDARYGDNPNRLGHYYQYQVVLKPPPKNILDIYLESLEFLGLNLQYNDIRFVEDNWENPTLGAWGLGWEVWLNGMEITQFTYFQQVGGLACQPISGEITYGLERLAMYLQKKDNVFDLIWTDREKPHDKASQNAILTQNYSDVFCKNILYSDVFLENEKEQSIYNFERADIAFLFQIFILYEQQANNLLEAPALPLPAYEMVLKAAHTFNLLDARGAISVTERAGYIGRIRSLSKQVAQSYYASREALGFPLLKH